LPHAEALGHFLHRNQELIASSVRILRMKKPAVLPQAFFFFEHGRSTTTLFQDLVSKTLTVETITPDNGGRPQGHSRQRRKGCSQFVA
jgi:hypothetical protein